MPNGTPPATPVPPEPRRGGNRVALIVGVLLALAAVGAGAYFLGKEGADAKGARRDGELKGRLAATAAYAPGTSKYQAIYRRGLAAGTTAGRRAGERQGAERGRKIGFDRGKRVGDLQGARQGIVSGSNAALGGFTDWTPGAYYIVKFGTGANGVAYAVDSRKQMTQADRYAICANNPGDICTQPIGGGG
ncbi:MAG: hypothetical protein QOE65_311 [Solirubrobacteraceae bacterium]|jgi:hypothetical protein|nr:hypothetical protein [Solirubrobacteraceae bacterium]